jgi:predicted ATPase/class 3 adenylate cyclase
LSHDQAAKDVHDAGAVETPIGEDRVMAPPSGTVTLLFTDIEGSSRQWDQHPEEMASALRRHDGLLREAIESHGGYVFKTAGDAYCASFAAAASGVEAAMAAQRLFAEEPWPEPIVVRVRMGLHAGSCEERDGDYFGPTVNRAARIEAVAHGGQVVVSGVVALLLTARLPAGVGLRDLGRHRLKDLGAAEQIFQVVEDGLDQEFPPLRSLGDPRLKHNLPVQPSSFVGRIAESLEVHRLLQGSHLVTLTGPGGVGKSRLALQVAADDLDGSGDGVWLVELSAFSDPDAVAQAVAGVLSVREEGGRPMAATLCDALRDQELLLVLDNCEHLIGACAKLADVLLRSCPKVVLLATSREPFDVEGETVFRVPPLSVPAAGMTSASEAARCEAVALFVERAAQHVPDFVLDGDNVATVVSLCRRLDGVPLAIELASARLRSLSVAEIDARLHDHLRLLTGGRRTAIPRHQTARAMIDWSYDLLNQQEQIVLCRLSVFAGGWDLAAAEAVCAADDIELFDVVELVGSLVDKSLVQTESDGALTRYWLLATVQQYGAEHLVERGEPDVRATRDRHAAVYLALAEASAPLLLGPDQERCADRLELEHDNLAAAMAHATAAHAVVQALRLGIALRPFWARRGHWSRGASLLECALGTSIGEQPAALRAAGLGAEAKLLRELGKTSEALVLSSESVRVARPLQDGALLADLLATDAYYLGHVGYQDRALQEGEEALTLARRDGDHQLLATVLIQIGTIQTATGPANQDEWRKGHDKVSEALGLFEAMGDRYQSACCHNNLGVYQAETGHFAEARAHLTAALALWETVEGRSPYVADLALANHNLVLAALGQGDVPGAIGFLRSALTVGPPVGWLLPYEILAAALCATKIGDTVTAATLHGGADTLLAENGEVWQALEAHLRDDDRRQLSEMMGTNPFDVAYHAGQRSSRPELIALAIDVCAAGGTRGART